MRKNSSWYFALIVVSGHAINIQAQNLVPNPSFEESASCPGNFTEAAQKFTVNDWSSATFGTPDHFHSCSTGEADVPYNWAGVSDAFEGHGYTGIYAWMDNDNHYREYLQCKLLSPLLKDSLYHIEFHYKLSSYSKYSIDRIGLVLTDSLLKARHDHTLFNRPTLSVIQDSALTKNTGLWEMAQIKYKAIGGEQYLTLGNFSDNFDTHFYKIEFRPISQEMLAHSAYYYVDDVRVLPLYEQGEIKPSDMIPEFSLSETALNTTYVLKNIQFELNSYKLINASFDELDQVAEYMMRHPKITVQLFGHTDDQGDDAYNMKLSHDRAKNAGGYLLTLGIKKERIEIFGYGKTKPLIPQITEEARSINRRVEIRFIR
jgi:OOP family OmpA-OmpF porin